MILPETITYEEAQARYRCHRKAIKSAVDKGIVEAYKPGKAYLIDLKSADSWFLSTKVKPVVVVGRPRKGARRQ